MKPWLLVIIMILLALSTACRSSSAEGGNSAGEGKTTVTLSIRQENAFYETFEKKFEERYPDIDLQIKAYKQNGEKATSEDYENYRETANTELLSGKGADIYEISSLPIGDYVNKQLFLDMTGMMEQDQTLNKSDLEMSVLNALRLSGGTYAIPAGFSLRAFVGDGDALANENVDDANWTWEQFGEVSKMMIQKEAENGDKSRYALADYPPDFLFQEMIVDRYAEFVDYEAKKAKFDSPAFVDLLKQIKKMYDDKVMTGEAVEPGKQMFYSTLLQSPPDFVNGPYLLFDNPVLLQKPHAEGQPGGMRIVPLDQFAIRAKTPVKEEAWKVMSFLLSEEAQSLQDRAGFSLLQSVNDKKLDDVEEQVKNGTFKLPDGNAAKVSDEQFAKFKQLIHTADNYAALDGQAISIAGGESVSFFGGQKSAEEVAKLIQNRIATYLNE